MAEAWAARIRAETASIWQDSTVLSTPAMVRPGSVPRVGPGVKPPAEEVSPSAVVRGPTPTGRPSAGTGPPIIQAQMHSPRFGPQGPYQRPQPPDPYGPQPSPYPQPRGPQPPPPTKPATGGGGQP